MSKLKVPQLLQQAEQHEKSGKLAEMEQLCREILEVRQDVPKVWQMLGMAARKKGETTEAIGMFQKSLAIFPDSPKVLCELASALVDAEQIDQALPLLTKAQSLRADSGDIALALGKALLHQQRFAEAQVELQKAVEKNPKSAEARLKLGNTFRGQGKHEQALIEYQAAVRVDGNYADGYVNLGAVCFRLGRVEDALLAYRQAVTINPQMFQAHNNLGVALNEVGQHEAAVAHFQAAVKINPQHAKAYHGLGMALRAIGSLDAALGAFKKAVELNPQSALFNSSLVYALNFAPSVDAKARFEAAREWATRFADPHLGRIPPHTNDNNPTRRLKIGYVSADFRHHPVILHFDNVLRHHQREEFEVYCYSNVALEDPLTERIRGAAHQWRPIATLDDDAVERLVREDGIDILVDLSLHSPGNRLPLFARKPAPVQVTWLGYVGTTGLKQIDYRLTDRFLDPPERSDEFYSERSFRLPDCESSFDPITPPLPSNGTPALAGGSVMFGTQVPFSKVNEPIVSLWASVLKAVPQSRMLVQVENPPQRKRLAAWFAAQGIAPERIELVQYPSRLEYLKGFQRIDVVLDTYPFCGGTSTLDAFWMGVPVLSLCGRDAISRTCLSIAANCGLAETLVVTAPQQFVERAITLVADLQRLNALRQQILPRLQKSPLMDLARFARNLEAAYREMWQTWCKT